MRVIAHVPAIRLQSAFKSLQNGHKAQKNIGTREKRR